MVAAVTRAATAARPAGSVPVVLAVQALLRASRVGAVALAA